MRWELHAGMFDVQVHVLADQALTLQFSTNNPHRNCSALPIFLLFLDCIVQIAAATARPGVNVQDLWQSFLACETLSDPQGQTVATSVEQIGECFNRPIVSAY